LPLGKLKDSDCHVNANLVKSEGIQTSSKLMMHHTHSTSVGTGPDKSLSLTEQNLKSLSGVNLKRDKDLKIEILDANQLATSKTQKGKEPSNIIEEVPLNTGKFWRQVKDDFTDTFLKMKQEFAIKKQ
jgi:hypothetical protein